MVSTWPTRSRKAHRTAYGAVAKPVEGTILTVIRESAAAAVTAAERDDDIEKVMAATVEAAERSVALDAEPARRAPRGGRRGFGRARYLPAVRGRAACTSPAVLRQPRRAKDRPPAPGRLPRSSPTRTRASATRRCSSSIPTVQGRLTSMPSATGSTRSAISSLSPAMRGPSRSMSTTNDPIWSSGSA